MKTILTLIIASLSLSPALAGAADVPLFPQLEIKTTEGSFIVELDSLRSPITTQNFVQYARDKHYDGMIFHRVMPEFVAQSGGFDSSMKEKPTREAIVNESGNGLSNSRGTIAMARTDHPHSATSQFYINLDDNSNLDPNAKRWGYCVFGMVIEGMDILDKIAAIPTGPKAPFSSDVPQKTVTIESVRLVEEKPAITQ